MEDARVKVREEQGESVLAAVPSRVGLPGFIPSPPSLSCHEMWDSWAGVVAVLGTGAESRVERENKREQELGREWAHGGHGCAREHRSRGRWLRESSTAEKQCSITQQTVSQAECKGSGW